MSLLWLVPLYLFAVTAPLSVAAGNIATALVVVAAAAALVARPETWRLLPRRLLWALAAVLVWNAVSCALAAGGDRQWFKLGEEWWMKLLAVTVPVLLLAARRRARDVVTVVLASGVVIAAYGILQHFTGWDLVRHKALLRTGGSPLAVGFTGHHLSFGGQLMFLAAMAAGLACAGWRSGGDRTVSARWPATIAAGLLLVALLWTYARSSLLAVAAALGVLVLMQTGRVRRLGLLVMVLGALAVAATPSLRGRMTEAFTDPKEVTRLNLWRSSAAGIAARPLVGWGPGNFDRMLDAYEVPGYYEARGHAHNDYLMQAVNAGIPGLLLFLWLHGEIALLLWRARRRWGDPDGIMAGALACQAAAAVGGMFQVFQTDDEPEMLLYFLLGLGIAAALAAARDGTGAPGGISPQSGP